MTAQDELHFWTQMLRLDGFQVAHVHRDTPADPIQLTLIPATALGICPNCQHCCADIHRRSESHPVRDLPCGPQTIELVIRTYQFSCPNCGHFFTPPSAIVAPGAHATERFLEHVARMIRFSDVANAAGFFGVPEKTLERWYYDHVERQRQSPPVPAKPIQQLGIDELRMSGRTVAVIIDHTNERVLEVLPNRTKEAVSEYLTEQKDTGLLSQVREVTIDMCSGYEAAVRAVFKERADVTIDRFHVVKNFQERLTEARREIQRSLPKVEARDLKGTRWLWLTNRENLSAEELAELAALHRQFPELKQLSDQRESLRAVFEDETIQTSAAGINALKSWLKQARELGLKALDSFCQTLEKWLDGIANYFVNRASNGRTEGFNLGLRSVLWRAFGMSNFEHFRLRVLDRFGRPKAS